MSAALHFPQFAAPHFQPAQVRAQEPAPASAPEQSVAELQKRIEDLQASPDLEEATKGSLVEIYKKAIAHLEMSARLRTKIDEYARQRQEAAAALTAVRDRLANPPDEMPIDRSLPLAKLEQLINEKRAALVAEEKAVANWDEQTKRRADRRLEIPKIGVAAGVRLDELEHALATPDSDGEDPRQTQARRALLLAEHHRVAIELEAIKQEMLAYEATDELLPLERDAAFRQQTRSESRLKLMRELADKLRLNEAELSAARAHAALQAAATAHPFVLKIADANARTAEQRTALIERHQTLWHEVEVDRTRLQVLTKDLARMQQRAELRGLENIGVLLRRQAATLPDPHALRRKAAALRTEMADAELALFDAQDQRTGLSDIEHLVETTKSQLDPATPLPELDNIEMALREHLERQRENVDALIKTYKDYTLALDVLASARDELADKSEEYGVFIAERVLWVRSAGPIGASTVTSAVDLMQAIAAPRPWSAIGESLWQDFYQRPLLYLVPLLLFALALRLPSRLRRRLRELGKMAARGSTDTFRPTAEAVLATAALAAIVPAFMGIVAWRLFGASNNWLADAIGNGLLATAIVYLPSEMLRQVCRPQGLGEAHFGWSARGLHMLRRSLLRLMLVALPLVFVVAAVNSQDNDGWRDSLGRLAFLAVMLLVAQFLWRVLRPTGGILQEAILLQPGRWLDRFRLIWYPAAVGAPLFLAGLTAWGFSYTAIQLAWRLQSTLGLILLLILLHALARRWLLIARRRLAMDQARQRRAALSENKELGSVSSDSLCAELQQADLSVVNLQTRKLLQSVVTLALGAGLYLIWIDVLPALGILNQRELWSVSVIDTLVDASGAAQGKIERLRPITWANGALALVAIVMTVLATRNIPGLLEITLLQRLPLEPGGRYAITTISRYLLIIAGVVFTCGQLGLGWSRVQWLAAAVTVGLGFGLQEIFANFVSGLIILFERPIRVGDTITVGGMTGNVSRIRIRATTITDGDRKELIVPNKEFITGQVLNWTLSDPMLRLVIPIGVGYDSDTEEVQRLIVDVARRHPGVLREPSPTAYFEGFGDSRLNFNLRAFVPSLENLGETRHSLHTEINRALRAANIELAFPQRDVHIKSLGPLTPPPDAAPPPKASNGVPQAHFTPRGHG